MKKKCLYLTLEGINSTVFKSQVYELINSDISKNFNACIICFQPINIKWNKNKLVTLINFLKDKKVKKILIPYIAYKNLLSIYLAIIPFLIVVSIFKIFTSAILIHCRAQEACFLGCFASRIFKNLKVYCDIRGVPYEELKDTNIKRADYFKRIDRYIFNRRFLKDDRIMFNFVSNKLKLYYEEMYSIKIENNFSIVPCFSSFNSNKQEKADSSKMDNIKFLYVGGQQKYQKLDEFGSIIKILGNQKTEWVFCINGEPNKEIESSIKRAVSKVNAKCEFHYNLNRNDLDCIYSKCTVGVVFRDNSSINKVASPVKISEYLSKGIFTLLIGDVGDFFSYISSNKYLGYTCKSLQDLNANEFFDRLDRFYDFVEKRIVFAENFSKPTCIEKYIKSYKSLIERRTDETVLSN